MLRPTALGHSALYRLRIVDQRCALARYRTDVGGYSAISVLREPSMIENDHGVSRKP